MNPEVEIYKPQNPIRVITATSLFDGHDATINIIRRILQDTGVEVIHLAHNRSVQELVDAAIQEDVQGIAMSSYQGGHMEAFKYMIDLLKENGCSYIKVFGGGGGVIIPDEIKELEKYGVAKIYSPEDGTVMGLQGMVNHMVMLLDFSTLPFHPLKAEQLTTSKPRTIAGFITAMQQAQKKSANTLAQLRTTLSSVSHNNKPPVLGITGTGGAGKSSLTDELLLRFASDFSGLKIATICCDPSRKKTGGALLGDRIRMNSLGNSANLYMRSLATQSSSTEVSQALPDAINVAKAAGFDLIIIETAGIGQGDSIITELADISLYVMTSDYGAPSQLEKIEMLDFADICVINKFEKKGSEDAIRDIRKQVQRNRKQWETPPEDLPIFGTIASKFNDDGVTALYHGILETLAEKTSLVLHSKLPEVQEKVSTSSAIILPSNRINYLAEIASAIEEYHQHTAVQAEAIRNNYHLSQTLTLFKNTEIPPEFDEILKDRMHEINKDIDKESEQLVTGWHDIQQQYSQEYLSYNVRGKKVEQPLKTQTLSHLKIPKISLPNFTDPGDIYTWRRKENLPGYFPFTGGLFPLKRTGEDPTRMFAGEGGPERTNQRFKMLSADYPAKRLSTAFDSVTLYGWDPSVRPDIYGKIGTSGVNICTLDDLKVLYDGFDLNSPTTSVSMTINGPAPIILAMFMNCGFDQQLDLFSQKHSRAPNEGEYKELRADFFTNVRGTVQADILKEDQGQNTCIFSIEFALKMMGDIQEFFIENKVKNFYSASVSGYHIAEAGANPITQLALTLSNGFTYVEYYLSRGMDINEIAPSLSFFFSNGMDPEYTVIGRVARRIWAIAMREKYGADCRSQKLKYHIQTSGRSLHSQEIQLNDIRTTLQALCAIYDNCNSLHTNAYDEAITTPSSESVRRALAIQLIINKEWGLAKNENMNQGSFIVEELTDLVEEAVLEEFQRITDRGGVLGAMETGYQRAKIQEESMAYERVKHSGELPIIGVNTFRKEEIDIREENANLELSRSTDKEKNQQIARLTDFQQRNAEKSPEALTKLKEVALRGDNIFEELLNTVRYCSLGQITQALYEVGGQYRRNM